MQPGSMHIQENVPVDIVAPYPEHQLDNSGTYDLAGSFKKPGINHGTSFGQRDQYMMPHPEQVYRSQGNYHRDLQESTGKLNLTDGYKGFEENPTDLRINQSIDQFNLSNSGRHQLTSELPSANVRQYAQIDHFKHDEDLQVNLANSIREKEKRTIEQLIEKQKQESPQKPAPEEQKVPESPPPEPELNKSLRKQTEERQLEPVYTEEAPEKKPEEPKFPTFEDQLKEIREGLAKEYQEKMTRGFQELTDLKKDIASKQEVYETRQVRELRREIKKLEDALMEQKNEKAEQQRQMEALKKVIAEKETIIDRMANDNQGRDG